MADSSEDSVLGWIENFGKKRIGVALAEKVDLTAQGLAAATALLAHIDEIEPVVADLGLIAVVRTLVAAVKRQILEESAVAVAPATSC
jgi:RNase H-fold protein (predicted Holliday junction resolvase)